MRSGQAPAASPTTNKAASGQANTTDDDPHNPPSDAETEVLPFSDNEGETNHAATNMDIDDPNDQPTASAEALADHDAAAAALAGLGEVAAEALPVEESLEQTSHDTTVQRPADDASDDDLSSDSELSDAPDEVAPPPAQEADDGQSDDGSSLSDDSRGPGAQDPAGDSDDALGAEEDDDDEEGEEEDEEADGDEDDDDDEDDDEEEDDGGPSTSSSATRQQTRLGGGRRARQELRDAVLAQEDAGDDREEEEDAASSLAALAGGATNVQEQDSDDEAEDTLADKMSQIGNKVAAATALRGRKPSIMGPQILIDPANESEPSTSRQPSPAALDEEEEDEDEEDDDVDKAEEDAEEAGAQAAEALSRSADSDETKSKVSPAKAEVSKDEHLLAGADAAAGTPLAEQPEPEEDTTTDEAAVRRVEALDALAKLEIKVAQLRDRLYIERSMEIAQEHEMILDGTHPELVHVTALIEARRLHKLRTLETWFEEEQRHFAKMAATEERQAHLTWRAETAELRRDLMEDWSSKRRKLEREKRSIDVPRPARRHQIFETELIGEPELAAAAARAAKADREPGAVGRRRANREAHELAELGSHIALPDLHGLDDYEAWTDLERMGIGRPDHRFGPAMPGAPSRASPQYQPPQRPSSHTQPAGPPPEMGFYAPSGSSQNSHQAWVAEQAQMYGPPPPHGAPPLGVGEMHPYGNPHDGHVYHRPDHMHEDMYPPDQHMYDPAYGPQRRRPETPPQSYPPESSRNGRHASGRGRQQSRGHAAQAHEPSHLDPYGRPLSPRLNGDPRYSTHMNDRHHHSRPDLPLPHQSPMGRPDLLPPDERDAKPYLNGHVRTGEYDVHPSMHAGHSSHQQMSPPRRPQQDYHRYPSEERDRPRGSRTIANSHQQNRSDGYDHQSQHAGPSSNQHGHASTMPPSQSHPPADSDPQRGAEGAEDNERRIRPSHTSGADVNGHHDSRSSNGPASSLPRQNGVASPRHPPPPAAAAAVAAAFEPSSPSQPSPAFHHSARASASADDSTTGTAKQHALDPRSDDGPRQSPPSEPIVKDGPRIESVRPVGEETGEGSAPGASSSGDLSFKTPEIAHRLPLSSEAEQSVAGDLGHPEKGTQHGEAMHAVKKEDAGPSSSSLQDHQRPASPAAQAKQPDDDTSTQQAPKNEPPVVSSDPAPQSYPPKPYEQFAS